MQDLALLKINGWQRIYCRFAHGVFYLAGTDPSIYLKYS